MVRLLHSFGPNAIALQIVFGHDSKTIAVVDVLSIRAGRVGSVSIYLMRFRLIETFEERIDLRLGIRDLATQGPHLVLQLLISFLALQASAQSVELAVNGFQFFFDTIAIDL